MKYLKSVSAHLISLTLPELCQWKREQNLSVIFAVNLQLMAIIF